MKINDYIIRGGENLNSAPLKTSSFPPDAEQIFNEWHSKLGKDDEEKENYFEMPVNDQNRLFIRSFYVEKSGNRPICFYVGLLIPRTAYIESKNYYCLHKGLCNIPFAKIQNSARSSFLPIEITTDWSILRTPIGLDFDQLSKMKLYGEKEFTSNLNQMCFSISINNIDDWFQRLFIAVNPYRLSHSFHIVVSRKQPRPPMTDPTQRHSAEQKTENTTASYLPASKVQVSKAFSKFQRVFFLIFILSLIICLYHFFVCDKRIPRSDYNNLKKEKENLQANNQKLSKKNESLEKEKKSLLIKIESLENEKKRLQSDNKNFSDLCNNLSGELSKLKDIFKPSTEKTQLHSLTTQEK